MWETPTYILYVQFIQCCSNSFTDSGVEKNFRKEEKWHTSDDTMG